MCCRLLCVQLQPVAARPPRNVMDALRHVGLERAGIGLRVLLLVNNNNLQSSKSNTQIDQP